MEKACRSVYCKFVVLASMASAVAWGQSAAADMSLDQFLNTQVTSVSKKEEKLDRATAAVFVINRDDMRRSGATNIPDLLRMVPGVEAAQIDANAWAITIRGFNQRYSNKVLVLVDGRSVYAPGFSGIYWDQIDMPLEDIERIEVIRGPGASVGGANAMNGVINILTLSSKATEGSLVSASGSAQGDASGTPRYGGDIGSEGSYRPFAKYTNDAGSELPDHSPGRDGWSGMHGGFRSDWDLSAGYRSQKVDLPPGYEVSALAPARRDSLYSAFFQDEIQVASNVWLTLGAKLEHYAYTGFEYEPNARIAWAPDDHQTLWASASKAIRQPSRVETDVSLELGSEPVGPGLAESIQLIPNPHFRSEQVCDFQTGYRRQFISKSFSFDADVFLSFYRDLATYEPEALAIVPGPVTTFQGPVMIENKGNANDYGAELSLNWTVNSRWRISPGYSPIHINYWLEPSSGDTLTTSLAGNTPRNMIQMRSAINLTRRLEWDQTVYWSQAFPNGAIPAHTRADIRLAWKVNELVEVGLTGQNLLRPDFREFGDFEGVVGTKAPRSVIRKVTWRF